MLDFGFSEILLTSAIALVVLGPERLPKVARQVGNWMGRARAMARQLSEQLEREVGEEEFLKQQRLSKAALAQAAAKAAHQPVSEAAETLPGAPATAAGATPDSAAEPTAAPVMMPLNVTSTTHSSHAPVAAADVAASTQSTSAQPSPADLDPAKPPHD